MAQCPSAKWGSAIVRTDRPPAPAWKIPTDRQVPVALSTRHSDASATSSTPPCSFFAFRLPGQRENPHGVALLAASVAKHGFQRCGIHKIQRPQFQLLHRCRAHPLRDGLGYLVMRQRRSPMRPSWRGHWCRHGLTACCSVRTGRMCSFPAPFQTTARWSTNFTIGSAKTLRWPSRFWWTIRAHCIHFDLRACGAEALRRVCRCRAGASATGVDARKGLDTAPHHWKVSRETPDRVRRHPECSVPTAPAARHALRAPAA